MTVPTRFPFATMLWLLIGCGLAFAVGFGWAKLIATPAQAFYLRDYVRSAIPALHWSGKPEPLRTFQVMSQGRVQVLRIKPSRMRAWLNAAVYQGGRALRVPGYAAAGCLGVCLPIGLALDAKRRRTLFLDGERIRGPEGLTWRQYNRRHKGDGLRLAIR